MKRVSPGASTDGDTETGLIDFVIPYWFASPQNSYTAMDRRSAYSLSVLAPDPDAIEDSKTQIQAQLRDFILEFRLDNAFIYRCVLWCYNAEPSWSSESDQIRQNVLIRQYYCDVDVAHLISYNEELAHKLTTQPAEIIPSVGHQSGALLYHWLVAVWISTQAVYESYCISIEESRRNKSTRASAAPPFFSLSDIDPRPWCH